MGKTRKTGPLVLVACLVLLSGAVQTDAASKKKQTVPLPSGTLNSEQIITLFSDQTVESVTAVRGRVSQSYYDPGGEVRQVRNGTTRTGRWRVTKNGRICLQMEDRPEKCRIIVQDGALYKKYIVKKNGKHQHSVSYRKFWDGNPFGL